MILLKLIFVLFAFVMVVGFITQLLIPMFSGTPTFPLFRNSDAKETLKEWESKLEEAVEVAAIQERLSAVADKVSSKLKNGDLK